MKTLREIAQTLGVSSSQISSTQLTKIVTLRFPVLLKKLLGIPGIAPTPEQRSRFKMWFPNLLDFTITGPQTPYGTPGAYNCIAWSVGVSDHWFWPGNTIGAFDAFYASYGWNPSANGKAEYQKRKVALWGFAADRCTHGSREIYDCNWHESKCGSAERIFHNRFQMEDGDYGKIIKYYEKYDPKANLDLAP